MKIKFIFLLFVIAVAASCNPKDVNPPAPISITYELVATANTSAQFNLTYNSASGQRTATASHGWAQVTLVETRPFAASVSASINTNAAFPFTLRILYNGVPRKENTGTTVPGAITALSVSETFN
jgi:hypothetical protein